MNEILNLPKKNPQISGEIFIGGSKSESNRLLILNALFGQVLNLQNLSDSEDSRVLQKGLASNSQEIDIHHAGTAMRFLTAFYAIQEGTEKTLTGSARMKERPIGILVEALRSLGAEISYLEKEGFPPLKIKGKAIHKDFVELQADTSSQYITALMLVAPKLPKGLTIQLKGKITSLPYIKMTIALLERLSISVELNDNRLTILPIQEIQSQNLVVESDWSSASYFYSFAALGNPVDLKIHSFYQNSLQGDSALVKIYEEYFGIHSEFDRNQIRLTKNSAFVLQDFELDLNHTPDIAQTIMVTAAALNIKCKLTGLETLKIKETDRIQALENELKKLGVETIGTSNSIEITGFESVPVIISSIKTYNDHRMAMSFAPLCLIHPISIENPEVVGKSYPNFWKDIHSLA